MTLSAILRATVPVVVALSLLQGCSKIQTRKTFYFPGTPGSVDGAPPQPGVGTPTPIPTATAQGYAGLGAESVPPEVMAKYAAPPLPPDQSRRIQGMLDVRSPGAGLLSPDGKKLYFTWGVTGTTQVWRLDGPMGFPTQLTGGEDTTTIAGMTPDGKFLLLSRDRSGEENPGLYLQSEKGGPLELIKHQPKVQVFLEHIADDGKSIFYRANDKKPDAYAIYRYDIASKSTEVVFAEDGLWSVDDERGGKLLMGKSVGGNMTEYFEYSIADKKLTPLFGQGEREDYQASYGAPGEIIVLTNKPSEYRRLYVWKDGKLAPISAERKHDVSGFTIDRAKKRVIYTVNEGGYARVSAVDPKTKSPIKMPKLPTSDAVQVGALSRDGRYMSLLVDSGTSPAEAYVYDWDTSSLTRWHKPSAPEIDTATFSRVSLESYPARDGTQIPMFVRKPKSCTAPCPVIVSFHGGPEAQAVAGFSTRAQLFVDAGFVYAEPNVRGSDGYGKAWLHADDGPKRLQVITDIEDAGKYIREKWAAGGTAPRVGVYGGSYGGYSTLVAMSMFAGTYDVGVSVVGISSLLTFLENTAPYRRILRISEYGDPTKDRQALEALSPINYVDRVKAPLMLIQGATDPRVPVGEAIQFYESLQKRAVPSELIIFPDEGHGMRKRGNQVLAMGHTIAFFKKHLAR